MKVMVIVKATNDSEAGTMPSEELLRDMGLYNESLVKAGILLSGEGLYPSSQGARVRFSGKNRTVVDGPFAETKELVAGFWVWQVKSMEEAIEWVKRCPNPMLTDSEIEIRRVFAPEDFAPIDPTGEWRAHEEQLTREIQSYQLESPRFEIVKERTLAGLKGHFTDDNRNQIPELWMQFVPSLGKIPTQKGQDTYGVCSQGTNGKGFDYLAAVEVEDTAKLPPAFASMRLPTQRYAVFAHTKHVSKICETIDAIYKKWLPNSGLEAARAPFFEKYTEAFNPDQGVGGIEIWVPLKA